MHQYATTLRFCMIAALATQARAADWALTDAQGNTALECRLHNHRVQEVQPSHVKAQKTYCVKVRLKGKDITYEKLMKGGQHGRQAAGW